MRAQLRVSSLAAIPSQLMRTHPYLEAQPSQFRQTIAPLAPTRIVFSLLHTTRARIVRHTRGNTASNWAVMAEPGQVRVLKPCHVKARDALPFCVVENHNAHRASMLTHTTSVFELADLCVMSPRWTRAGSTCQRRGRAQFPCTYYTQAHAASAEDQKEMDHSHGGQPGVRPEAH